MLGQFNRYPIELLTGYAELTAAYLRAIDGMHTISGTGIFRKAGRTLIEQLKKRREDESPETSDSKSSQAAICRTAVATAT
jgi:hypothetical protein